MKLFRVAIQKHETLENAKEEIWENFTGLLDKEKIFFSKEDLLKIDDAEKIKKTLLESVMSAFHKTVQEIGETEATNLVKYVYLRVIDMFWVQHLTEIDRLRAGIGLVGYGQKDPLVEYKHRSYNMFRQLQGMIDANFARTILRMRVDRNPNNNVQRNETKEQKENVNSLKKEENNPTKTETIVSKEKPGRNDPCPCGSGKKYKKCCGANK